MATEMSEQIVEHLKAGEYSEAAAAVVRAWNEHSTFGVRHCPLPGLTDLWVKFKTSGYPFKLRKQWDAAKTDTATLAVLLPYIVEWNLIDVDGQPVALPDVAERTVETVANIEDALLMWLIREFTVFWFTELLTPRKNS
jgi:hypothetical protein